MGQRSIMKVASVFVFFWGLVFLFCQTRVSGTKMSRRLNMTFEMGRDATLTCNVRGIGKKRVIWKRLADPVPIAVGTTRFQAGRKYRVKRNGEDWQLIIKNVDKTDAGEYECRLTGRDEVADILSIIIPSDNHPHFMPTQTTVTTRVGRDAVLPCQVNNLRKSLVMWLKGSSGAGQVLSLRKKLHSGVKRHKVLHTQRPEWSLQIRNVEPQDFGVYTCVVNTRPPITRTVELLNGDPASGQDKEPEISPSKGGNPRLVKETFKEEVEVTQYKSVTLTCQFRGDPKPTVVWERRLWTPHGEKVTEDLKTQGETYTITNAQPQDAGIYVCKANNRVPPPAQARIKVKVKEVMTTTTPKPTTTTFDPVGDAAPRVYALQEVIYQERGRDVELGCRAVGVPRPLVHWRAAGQYVHDSAKFGVRNEPFRHHTVFSTLHVRSLGKHDFKNYSCYAVNKLGDATTTMVLARRVP